MRCWLLLVDDADDEDVGRLEIDVAIVVVGDSMFLPIDVWLLLLLLMSSWLLLSSSSLLLFWYSSQLQQVMVVSWGQLAKMEDSNRIK
jgi:hypothetical protein